MPPLPEADDLTLIYTREGGLWRWQQGEAAHLAGEAYFPSISSGGRMAAFLRPLDASHQEIWAVDVAGGNERRLVSVADLDRMGGGVRDPNAVAVNPHYTFDWQPQTERLAFTNVQVYNGPGEDPLDDLYMVDAANGQIIDVFLAGWGGRFAFSPDGSQMVVVRPDTVILTEPTGKQYSTVMSYRPVLTYSEEQYYAGPQWSPDGTFLRVAIPPEDALAEQDQLTTLWRIPTDGSPAAQEGSVSAIFFVDAPVEYSPDLAHVAYIKEIGGEQGGLRELHLAAYDGSADRVYADGEMLQFAGWASDGRRFLFTRGDEGEAVLGSLDGEPRPLGPETTGAFRVQWVDDHRFIYVIHRESAFELRLHDINGGNLLIDAFSGSPPVFDVYP